MRCNKAREFLSQHIDDQLPPAETGELTRHLDACAECREFQADLRIGQRLLAATEPRLPDNFDWKLQLRLNQTLREAAGDSVYPWEERPGPARWAFLRNFGTATAAGLAAVLSLAMFLGPQVAPRGAALLAGDAATTRPTTSLASDWASSDRLPLYLGQPRGSAFSRNNGVGRPVSGGTAGGAAWSLPTQGGWTVRDLQEAQEMQRLRFENRRLRSFLGQYQQQVETLQTRLDTMDARALDLRIEPRHED